MDLRDATREDLPAIRELVAGIAREYGFPPEPEGADADLYADADAYFADGGLLRVLVADAAVVGMLGVVPHRDGAWELRKIYLHAGHRGGGHGRRLLEEAIAFARAQAATKLVLQSSSKLGEALRLYERAGFARVATETRSCTCDVAMELSL